MSTLSLRLPDSIHHNAKIYAEREGISLNQLAATALAEKLAALAAEDYIAHRAKRASKAKFDAALGMVPDVPPMPGDERRSVRGVSKSPAKRGGARGV